MLTYAAVLDAEDTVTKVCASPRNSTWFTRPFLLVRGWGLGTRLELPSHVHLMSHSKTSSVHVRVLARLLADAFAPFG